MLQRGSLPSEIALQGGSLEARVQNGVSRGRCGLQKTEKIFSANNEKNYLENFKPLYTNKKVQLQLDFLISPAVAGLFLLVIKSPVTAGPLKAGLPLPSSCCKGETCLPRSHYKGEASSPKWCIEQ